MKKGKKRELYKGSGHQTLRSYIVFYAVVVTELKYGQDGFMTTDYFYANASQPFTLFLNRSDGSYRLLFIF